jgi:hypothetical protein
VFLSGDRLAIRASLYYKTMLGLREQQTTLLA